MRRSSPTKSRSFLRYDVGASYRSAIFYISDEQKRNAEDTIADVNASGNGPARW